MENKGKKKRSAGGNRGRPLAARAADVVFALEKAEPQLGTILRDQVLEVRKVLQHAVEMDAAMHGQVKEDEDEGGGQQSGNARKDGDGEKERFAEEVSTFLNRLSVLAPGDQVLVLAGNKQCSLLYVVDLQASGYAFTVVNTGCTADGFDAGMNYHPFWYDNNMQLRRQVVQTFSGISRERILDPAVWFILLQHLVTTVDFVALDLYEVVLPHLTDKCLSEARDQPQAPKEQAFELVPWDLQGAQRQHRLLERGVRFLLERRGASLNHVALVSLEMALVEASIVCEDVRRVDELPVAGQNILGVFLEQLKARLLEDSHIQTKPQRERAAQVPQQIEDAMKEKLAQQSTRLENAPFKPVLNLENFKSRNNPMYVSGLCHRTSTDAWAGPVVEMDFGHFVDLRLKLPMDCKGEENMILELIHACATNCQNLFAQNAAIGYDVMVQRLTAMIEHCFLEQLTRMPEPPGSGVSNDRVVVKKVQVPGRYGAMVNLDVGTPVLRDQGKIKGGVPGSCCVQVSEECASLMLGETLTSGTRWVSIDAGLPADSVDHDPDQCVFRRLWDVQHPTMQKRFVADLHTIITHYSIGFINDPVTYEYDKRFVAGRRAVTLGCILCLLDAGLRTRSPGEGSVSFLTEILRGSVIFHDEVKDYVPCGFSSSSLRGLDLKYITSNLHLSDRDLLQRRKEVLTYLEAVEALATPKGELLEVHPREGVKKQMKQPDVGKKKPDAEVATGALPGGQAGQAAPAAPQKDAYLDQPLLLFDWRPKLVENTWRGMYSPSVVDESQSHEKVTLKRNDDLTLRMLEACKLKFLGQDGQPERPPYMKKKGGDFGGMAGPIALPGMGSGNNKKASVGLTELHPFVFHKWKQAPEVHMASEIVWLYRTLLEQCATYHLGDGDLVRKNSDNFALVRSPVMAEPKWLHDEFAKEGSKLALVVGSYDPDQEPEQGAINLNEKDQGSSTCESVFDWLAKGVVTDDAPKEDEEADKQTNNKQKEGDDEGDEEELVMANKKDPVRLLSRAKPLSEADVLFCKELNNFSSSFSVEESELFHTIITAPTLAVPLLLQFFASQRVGNLINEELRNILERLLFEPGPFRGEPDRVVIRGFCPTKNDSGRRYEKADCINKAEYMDFAQQIIDLLPSYMQVSVKVEEPIDPLKLHHQICLIVLGGGERCRQVKKYLEMEFSLKLFQIRGRVLSIEVSPPAQGKTWPTWCPFQLPVKKAERSVAREDEELYGFYTGKHVERDTMLATSLGRFVSELLAPSARSILQMWVDLCLGASSLSSERYDTPGVDLLLFFCRCSHRITRLCRWLEVDKRYPEEFKKLIEWLGEICSAQLHAFIAQAEEEGEWECCIEFHRHLLLVLDVQLEKEIDIKAPSDEEVQLFNDLALSSAFVAMKKPMYEVELILLRRRPQLLAWADSCKDMRNRLLDQIVNLTGGRSFASCRQQPLRAQKWTMAKLEQLNCEHVFESSHPIAPGMKSFDTIHFANAPYMTIFFDPSTELDSSSCMQFFYDPACTEPVGEEFRENTISGNWPGTMGRKPLIVPCSTIYYKVTTHPDTTAFGFKFRAIAPVSIEARQDLERYAAENGLAEGLDTLTFEVALQVTNNDLAQARRQLLSSRAQIIDKANQMRAYGTSGRGLFTDESGVIQVNLQSCEVCFNTQPPRKLPDEFAQKDGMSDCFPSDRPLYTIVESSLNRKWLQITHNAENQQITYMARIWTPPKPMRPEDDTVDLSISDHKKKEEIGIWGPNETTAETLSYLTEQGWPNYPVLRDGNLHYMGYCYKRVKQAEVEDMTKQSKFFARVVDVLQEYWPDNAKFSLMLWLETKERACMVYVRPSNGTTGQFTEAVYIAAWDVLHFYAIVDVGRRAHRKLVCSTDDRYCYARLLCSEKKIERKNAKRMSRMTGCPFTPLVAVARNNARPQSDSVVIERSKSNQDDELEQSVKLLNDLPEFKGFDGELLRDESSQVEIFSQYDLIGVVPAALLEGYLFWRRGDNNFIAYPREYTVEQGKSAPWWAGTALVMSLKGTPELSMYRPQELTHKRDIETSIVRVPWGADGENLAPALAKPLLLLNTMNPPEGSPLQKVTGLLSRIESLAWILVWSKDTESEEEKEITYIELPRFRLSFKLVQLDYASRLECVQQSGMYIKLGKGEESPEEQALLRLGLVRDWWPYILVETLTGQTQVLLANYAWRREKFNDNPVSTLLTPIIAGGAGSTWENTFPVQYYTYEVHPSATHLVGSPIEILFLVYLYFVAREYAPACRLTEYCFSDSTDEIERPCIMQFIYDHRSTSVLSYLPNLYAFMVRLDLSKALKVDDWDLCKENFDMYLRHVRNASVDCALTVSEELHWFELMRDLAQRASSELPKLLKDREQYLMALQNGSSMTLEVETGELYIDGGQGWLDAMEKNHEILQDALIRYGAEVPTAVPTAPTVEEIKPEPPPEGEQPKPQKTVQVKLKWSYDTEYKGIVAWRVAARVRGQGLRIYEVERNKRREQREKNAKKYGLMGFQADDSDDEDKIDIKTGVEMELRSQTGDPTPEVELTLYLPECTYEFYVEPIACSGKGLRSQYSKKFEVKLSLDEDMRPPELMPEYADAPDSFASMKLPVVAFKSPRELHDADAGNQQQNVVLGRGVIALMEVMSKTQSGMEYFVAIWRYLTGEIVLDVHKQKPKEREKQKKKDGERKGRSKLKHDEMRCLNCSKEMWKGARLCYDCGSVNCRQVGEAAPCKWLGNKSTSNHLSCLVMVRKIAQASGISGSFGSFTEAVPLCLLAWVLHAKSTTLPQLPAPLRSGHIPVAEGEGMQFMRKALKEALRLVPTKAETREKTTTTEKITWVPDLSSQRLRVVADTLREELSISLADVPNEPNCPQSRLLRELEACATAPLLPLLPPEVTAIQSSKGSNGGDNTGFQPKMLHDAFPEARQYLERIQRDFEPGGSSTAPSTPLKKTPFSGSATGSKTKFRSLSAPRGSRRLSSQASGSSNEASVAKPKKKFVSKSQKNQQNPNTTLPELQDGDTANGGEAQVDTTPKSKADTSPRFKGDTTPKSNPILRQLGKKKSVVSKRSEASSVPPAPRSHGLDDLLEDSAASSTTPADLAAKPQEIIPKEAEIPDTVLIHPSIKGLLGGGPGSGRDMGRQTEPGTQVHHIMLAGGQQAGEALKKSNSLKKGLWSVLFKERTRMDQLWNMMRQRFNVPNSKLHPRLLLVTLFSTQCREDLKRLSDGKLPEQDIKALEASLALVMIRAVCIAHLDLCLKLASEYHAKLCTWLKSALPVALESSSIASEIRGSISQAPGGQELIKSLTQSVAPKERIDKQSVLDSFVELDQQASSVIGLVKAKRYHGEWSPSQQMLTLDLRCLLIEFFKGLLLRERQVEISKELSTKAIAGRSSVQQMIMGAGKSTVIGPLLGLMLADTTKLVMLICPEALVPMSRDCLVGILGCVLGRKVYNFHWARSACPEIADIVAVQKKLERAVNGSGAFISTPTSIKTFMLQYISLLQEAEHSDAIFARPVEEFKKIGYGDPVRNMAANYFEIRDRVADEIAKVLNFWKSKCIAVIDEVDLVLHPLKSELNFPIGNPAKLGPQPQRWTLPMFLFAVVLAGVQEKVPTIEGCPAENTPGYRAMETIREVIKVGIESFSIQKFPHLVIMSKDWYDAELKGPMGRWALVFLERELAKEEYMQKVAKAKSFETDAAPVLLAYIGACKWTGRGEISEIVNQWKLSPESVQVLNLCRQWIRVLLVHCLGKRNRIDYGLLVEKDKAYTEIGDIPPSRQVMAVPFTGKDRPSAAAEFASPDVTIGLTTLAYNYEGLREFNFFILASVKKEEMQKETGPFQHRHNRILFQTWIEDAQLVVKNVHVLPLELLQAGDFAQLTKLATLLADSEPVREHYLNTMVFSTLCYVLGTGGSTAVKKIEGTKARLVRLSSSSMDLGGEMLFKVRLGFTGTPSEVLPAAFLDPKTKQRCTYEPGSDAEIVRTLTSPSLVTAEVVEGGHPAAATGDGDLKGWTVESLLLYVASNAVRKHWYALIDTGALITGFSNMEVARELMKNGLKDHGLKGVVYLDGNDDKKVLMADGRENVPFLSCGLQPGERFTYFDQAHCTGMDIPQVINAVGVATLGKGMTLRDHAQACWRMRQLGKGQTIVVLIIPEVKKQIDIVAKDLLPEENEQKRLLRDVMAFLIAGQVKSQSLQNESLTLQEVSDCWRQVAMAKLRDSKCIAPYCAGDAVRVVIPKKENEEVIEEELKAAQQGGAQIEEPDSEINEENAWVNASVVADVYCRDANAIINVKLRNGKVVEVKNSDCKRSLKMPAQRLRFYPVCDAKYENLDQAGLEARVNSIKRKLKDSLGYEKLVKSEESVQEAKTGSAVSGAEGSAASELEQALAMVEAKKDQITAMIKYCDGEDPLVTVKKCMEELKCLLIKGPVDTSNSRTCSCFYFCLFNDLDWRKVILKQRKRVVDYYCKIHVIGAGEGFIFGTRSDKDLEEEEEEKPNEEEKEEKEQNADEEETKKEEEKELDAEIVDDPRAMEQFRDMKTPRPPVLVLRASVDIFREEMSQLLLSTETSLVPDTLYKRIKGLAEFHRPLCPVGSEEITRLDGLVEAARQQECAKAGDEGDNLESEMCQEQEQEQEQEKEQDPGGNQDDREFIEMDEMKPWRIDCLNKWTSQDHPMVGKSSSTQRSKFEKTPTQRDEPEPPFFYPIKDFVPQPGKDIPKLKVWDSLALSKNVSPCQFDKALLEGKKLRRLPNVFVILYMATKPHGTWVNVTLSEAETIRLWRNEMCMFEGSYEEMDPKVGLLTTSGLWLTKPVRFLPLTDSSSAEPTVLPEEALSSYTPVAFMRFFNAAFSFNNEEVVELMDLVAGNSCEAREKWIDAVLQARRRDRSTIIGTTAHKIVEMQTPLDLRQVSEALKKVSAKIRDRFPDTASVFQFLDENGDGRLQACEFKKGMKNLDSSLSDKTIQMMLEYMDKDQTGLVDMKELITSLGSDKSDMSYRVKQLIKELDKEIDPEGTTQSANTTGHLGPNTIQRKEVETIKRKTVRGLKAVLATGGDPGTLQLVCGHSACFHSDTVVSCRAGGQASVAPAGFRLTGDFAFYFEATLVEVQPSGSCIIGIASPDFGAEEGINSVGDDAHSWGVCGFGRRPFKRHGIKRPGNKIETIAGERWATGSVLGLLIDIKIGAIRLFVDGIEQDTRWCKLPLNEKPFIVPVFTIENGIKVELNWGAQLLRYKPPDTFKYPPRSNAEKVTIEQYQRLLADKALRSGPFNGVNPDGTIGEIVRVVDPRRSSNSWQVDKVGPHVYEITAPDGWYNSTTFLLCGMVLTSGCWYYEIEFLELGRYYSFLAGWGDANCNGLPGPEDWMFRVGMAHSWAFDLSEFTLWNDRKNLMFPHMTLVDAELAVGDVIGCLVDVDKGSCYFSYRGSFEPPAGLAFQKMQFVGGFRPAFTNSYGVKKVRVSLNAMPKGLDTANIQQDVAPVGEYIDRFEEHWRRNCKRAVPKPLLNKMHVETFEPGAMSFIVCSGPEFVDAEPAALRAMQTNLGQPQIARERTSGQFDRAPGEPASKKSVVSPIGYESDDDGHVMHSHGWKLRSIGNRPVVRGNSSVGEGRFYYEVRLVVLYDRDINDLFMARYVWYDEDEPPEEKKQGGSLSIGWCVPGFSGDYISAGVGDDRLSWGFEGCNPNLLPRLKHDAGCISEPVPPDKFLKEGQVVGVACSIKDDHASMQWAVDGNRINTGDKFLDIDLSIYKDPVLMPAISLHPGAVLEVNLGPDFWFGRREGNTVEPWEGSERYTPLCDTARIEAEKAVREKRPSQQRKIAARVSRNPRYSGNANLLTDKRNESHELDVVLVSEKGMVTGASSVLRPSMEVIDKWRVSTKLDEDVKAWYAEKDESHAGTPDVSRTLNLSGLIVAGNPTRAFHILLLIIISAKSVPRITEIDMSQNSMIDVPILVALTKLVKQLKDNEIPLRKVSLEYCKLQYDEAASLDLTKLLDELASCASLKVMHITGNILGKALSRFLQESGIEALGLADNQLDAEDAKVILPQLARSHLRNAHLGYNPIGDTSAMLLATELRYNRHLLELHLPACNLTPKGVSAIASCLYLKHKLLTLSLAYNTIGDQGASALAQMLSSYGKLHHLDVTSADIPSHGICEIADVVRQSSLKVLKIGDNKLDDAAGQAIADMLDKNVYLNDIDLGSYSDFVDFEPCNLLSGSSYLEKVVFLGRRLTTKERVRFLFLGCKACANMTSLETALLKVHGHAKVGAFFSKPLTYLLRNRTRDAEPGWAPNEDLDGGLERAPSSKSVKSVSKTQPKEKDQQKDGERLAEAADYARYLVKAKRRSELIAFLIKQRNMSNSSSGLSMHERPYVDVEDARSAVHEVIDLIKEDGVTSQDLIAWRDQVLNWMFGENGADGFPENSLTQLQICRGELATEGTFKRNATTAVLRDVDVRTPVDAWQIACKKEAKTALMHTIELNQTKVALLLIKRNNVKRCVFKQAGEDITWLYNAIVSGDGLVRYPRACDYAGIDMVCELTNLVPVRAAASRGLWEVVAELRNAGCRDDDSTMVEKSAHYGQTVWHELATPQAGRARDGDHAEQLAWAEELRNKHGEHLMTTDNAGKLPLHWSALNNYPRLTELLVATDVGAPEAAHQTDNYKYSPLMYATLHGNLKCVTVLLDAQDGDKFLSRRLKALDLTRDKNKGKRSRCSALKLTWSLIWALFHFEPSRSHLQWPISAYNMVLLQQFLLPWQSRQKKDKRANKDASSIMEAKKKVHDKILEKMNETTEGAKYRRVFVYKYLFRSFVDFVFLFLLLFYVSSDLFIGFLPSMDNIAKSTHAYMDTVLLTEPIPFSIEKFATAFADIAEPGDFWDFTSGVLTPLLLSSDDGFIDKHFKLVGSVRLQRKLYEKHECTIPTAFKPAEATCYDGHMNFWRRWTDDTLLNVTGATSAVQKLQNEEWLSEAAIVRAQFTLFNFEHHRLLVGELRVEFKSSGLAVPKAYLRVIPWIPLSDLLMRSFLPMLVLTGYTLFFNLREMFEMYVAGWREYISIIENWADQLQGAFLLTVCVVSFWLMHAQSNMTIDAGLEAFADFESIADTFVCLQVLFGSTLALQTMRFMKVLRLLPGVGPSVQAIAMTLADATVWRFLLYLSMMLIGLCMSMHIMFGLQADSYSTLADSFFSLYRLSFGDWDLGELVGISSVLGYVVFFLLSFILTGTLTNVFIAIVGERYGENLAVSEKAYVDEVNKAMSDWFGQVFVAFHSPQFRGQRRSLTVTPEQMKRLYEKKAPNGGEMSKLQDAVYEENLRFVEEEGPDLTGSVTELKEEVKNLRTQLAAKDSASTIRRRSVVASVRPEDSVKKVQTVDRETQTVESSPQDPSASGGNPVESTLRNGPEPMQQQLDRQSELLGKVIDQLRNISGAATPRAADRGRFLSQARIREMTDLESFIGDKE